MNKIIHIVCLFLLTNILNIKTIFLEELPEKLPSLAEMSEMPIETSIEELPPDMEEIGEEAMEEMPPVSSEATPGRPGMEEEIPEEMDEEIIEEMPMPTKMPSIPPEMTEMPPTTDMPDMPNPEIIEEPPPTEPVFDEAMPKKLTREEVSEEIIEEHELPNITKLQLDLEKDTKELTNLRLEMEGLSASEKSIINLLNIANERLTATTETAKQISKQKNEIVQAQDENAKQILDKIISSHGEIKESLEYIQRLEKSFDEQVGNIEKEKFSIEKRATKLQENINKIESQIKLLREGPEEIPIEEKSKKKEFTWYENIIVSIGNAIKWIKSFFVDTDITTTPPPPDLPEEKPTKELLENIVTNTGQLMKKGLRSTGTLINKIVEKSDKIQGIKKQEHELKIEQPIEEMEPMSDIPMEEKFTDEEELGPEPPTISEIPPEESEPLVMEH